MLDLILNFLTRGTPGQKLANNSWKKLANNSWKKLGIGFELSLHEMFFCALFVLILKWKKQLDFGHLQTSQQKRIYFWFSWRQTSTRFPHLFKNQNVISVFSFTEISTHLRIKTVFPIKNMFKTPIFMKENYLKYRPLHRKDLILSRLSTITCLAWDKWETLLWFSYQEPRYDVEQHRDMCSQRAQDHYWSLMQTHLCDAQKRSWIIHLFCL